MASSMSLWRRVVASVSVVLVAGACSSGGGGGGSAASGREASRPTLATSTTLAAPDDGGAAEVEPGEGESAAATPDAGSSPAGIYAATTGELDPSVADMPPRVYVPNSEAGTVSVIDPETYEVVEDYEVGDMPHHVVPAWDMQTLYALDTSGDQLIPIDPQTAEPGDPIAVEDPYNLYFTPDGEQAVVVAERFKRLDVRSPDTWELIASVPISHDGVNHGDFSADGRYMYVSTEWSGWVVKVDLQEHEVAGEAHIGEALIDVKLSPDGRLLFVADQARGGVYVVDAETLEEVDFLPTGEGVHGLYYSRDVSKLFATNRLGGSVSVIDVGSRAVEATWTIPGGGSPDMGGVSVDGSELWVTGRYHGEVYVFDTATGELTHRIPTAEGAHGLAIYPQPGRYSTGHTGIMR